MNSSTKNGPRISAARGASDAAPQGKNSPVRPPVSKRERRLTERERLRIAQAQAAPLSAPPHPPTPSTPEADAPEKSPKRSRRSYPSWLVSTLIHAAILLALGLFTLTSPLKQELLGLVVTNDTEEEAVEEIESLTEVDMEVAPEVPTPEAPAAAMAESVADSIQVAVAVEDAGAVAAAAAESLSTASLLGVSQLGSEVSELMGKGMTGELLGAKTKGQIAVVFDVSASMYRSVPLVVRELRSKFASAQVVAVHGASFKRFGTKLRLTPYDSNAVIHKQMYDNTTRGGSKANLPLLQEMHGALLSLAHCDSLPSGGAQSLGAALEALIRQPTNRPTTIVVFSDFEDGVDPAYLREVAQMAAAQKVKVVFYHPVKFGKDRASYEMFVKAAGGEIRETLPK